MLVLSCSNFEPGAASTQVLTVEYGDIKLEVQIKTLSDVVILEAGVLMATRGYIITALTDIGAQSAFHAALMVVATMRFDAPHERYFANILEAQEMLDELGMAEFTNMLRGAIIRRNPFVKKIC